MNCISPLRSAAVAAGLTVSTAFAQVESLAEYDFVNESMADSINNPNVVATDVTVNRSVMYWSGDGFTNICFGSAWSASGGHLEFSVAPANAGEVFNLTELDINYGGHGANGDVDRMEVYADEAPGAGGDNFQTLIFASNNLAQDFDIDLTGVSFLQGAAGPITFRVSFFDNNGSGDSNHEVDHFRVEGIRSSTPPPPGGNPCIGEQFFFGPNWSDSHYSQNGAMRDWFFPNWSSNYDVACIENGDDTNHGIPTIWSKNDCSIGCRRLEFTMKGRDNDGDSIGFTLGFCAGDETDPNADYLAVIWNGGSTQNATMPGSCAGAGTRPDGMHLVRVTGIPDPQEFWSQSNLDLPCSDLNSGVEFLAEAINLGDTGWPSNSARDVKVEILPGNLKVWVEGTLEFDRDGDYSAYLSGCFGYYNQSQFADYWGLEVTPLNPVVAASMNYGTGLPGCDGVPGLTVSAAPVSGQTTILELGDAQSTAALCCILLSDSQADIFVPFIGGSLLVGLPALADFLVSLPDGGLNVPIPLADDSCAAGLCLYLQMVCLDNCAAGGLSLSRGLKLTLGDL